jgi:hypothetical protein
VTSRLRTGKPLTFIYSVYCIHVISHNAFIWGGGVGEVYGFGLLPHIEQVQIVWPLYPQPNIASWGAILQYCLHNRAFLK